MNTKGEPPPRHKVTMMCRESFQTEEKEQEISIFYTVTRSKIFLTFHVVTN